MGETIYSFIYSKARYWNLVLFFYWTFISNYNTVESKITGEFMPLHYREGLPSFDFEFTLIYGPCDLETARRHCEDMFMKLFKPASWAEVTKVKKMWIPKFRQYLLQDGKKFWSDITFSDVEELEPWLFQKLISSRNRKSQYKNPISNNVTNVMSFEYADNSVYALNVLPDEKLEFFCTDGFLFPPPKPDEERENKIVSKTSSDDSVSITPTNGNVSTTPSDYSVSVTPTNDNVSTTPSDYSVSVTPTNDNVSTTPSDYSVNVTPTNDPVSTTTSSVRVTYPRSPPIIRPTLDPKKDVFCKGRIENFKNLTIVWPDTDLNSMAEVAPCLKGSYGIARRYCNGTKKDFDNNITLFCKEIDCSETREEYDNANRSFGMAFVTEHLRKCGNSQKIKPDDLFNKARNKREGWGPKESILPPVGKRKMKQEMNMILDMYDRLLDNDTAIWKKMKEETTIHTSMELIKETEETAWALGCLTDENLAMRKDNLAVEIFPLTTDDGRKYLNLSLCADDIGSIQLPENLKPDIDNKCNKQVRRGIMATYKNIENYLRPNRDMKITSGIIGVSLGDFNASYQLPGNKTVKIILNHPPRSPGATPVCVFLNWNYSQTDSEYGIWDSTGCYVTRHESEFTECECNHLTNFAILMNFAGPEFKDRDNYALDILSLICCSISSVSLLLTVIIYLTVKSLRSRRNMITCNLAICLLAMNILVQTGLKRVATTVCQITSAVLQYCVLCAFFWMLLEGILLYKIVIMVFETKKVRSIFLYFTAYGIPFVIVTLSSAMYPDAMIRQRYCWPSKEKGLIWSVLGPVLLIIVVNLIIFIMTLNAAAKIDKINSTSLTCEGRKKNLKQRTKGMMSLTCLLGFTWATGFFSLSNQSFVAYLFVFLNGLQGFFLFLTQMIFNEPVRSKLFAIYKENIAKISTATSSVQPSKDSDGKNTEKEKNKTKFIKSENLVVSTVEQHYPLPTAPPSPPIGDDLLQIRLTIIERRKKPQELHPFSLNENEV